MINNNFYKIENQESSSLSIEQHFDEAVNSTTLSIEPSDILRIEEEVSRSFSGVRSCSSPDTHTSNAIIAMNEWVQCKLFENRNLRYIKFGNYGGTAHWTDRWAWDGTRSCSGYVVIKCYIEFRKH
jgi:hypothetical protein